MESWTCRRDELCPCSPVLLPLCPGHGHTAPRWVGKSVPAANELLWGRTTWGGITQGQHAPGCLLLPAHVSGGRGKRGHGPPMAAAQTPQGWAHGNPTCPLPMLPPNARGSALLRAQGIAATARNLSQARKAPEAAGDSQVTLQCGDGEEIPSEKSRTQLSLPTAPHPACPSPSGFDLGEQEAGSFSFPSLCASQAPGCCRTQLQTGTNPRGEFASPQLAAEPAPAARGCRHRFPTAGLGPESAPPRSRQQSALHSEGCWGG